MNAGPGAPGPSILKLEGLHASVRKGSIIPSSWLGSEVHRGKEVFTTSHNEYVGCSDYQILTLLPPRSLMITVHCGLLSPLTQVYGLWQSPREKPGTAETAAPPSSPNPSRGDGVFLTCPMVPHTPESKVQA